MPNCIFTPRINNKIHTMTKKYDIIWSEELDSTNEEARRRISELDNLSVLSVERQTAGRGQRGNRWISAAGENLTFSIILKFLTGDAASAESAGDSAVLPQLKAKDQFVLSEISSLALVRLLENHGIRASVKWPNDIYIGSCKVCGMLIENSIHGSSVSSSIIGIGLNVNQRNFDVSLPNPTSMLLEDMKKEFDLPALLDEFMNIFVNFIDRFMDDRQDSFDELRDEYISHLWRLNETARFIDYTVLPSGHSDKPVVTGITDIAGKEFTGIIRGLSPIGHLLVEDLDAIALREFSFKEIGYII